jgi:peptide/nickel transport system permease protein
VIARSYLARRLAFALLVVFGVTVTTFLLMHAVPGDPAAAVLGEHATPAAVAALRRQWGLSQALPQQFGRFVVDLLTLRLGDSYVYKTPVTSLIASRIGLTAALVALATLFAVVITVPLATAAAARQDRAADHLIRAGTVIGLGMPSFWFGIILIEIFALRLHLLPVGGPGVSLAGHLRSLVLPGLTASLAIVPLLVRSLRVGMIEVLDSDYVAMARAKGLSELRVLTWHVARNAVIPTVTLLGLNIAFLIGSTVVVEQVFALNGLGSLLLDSIINRDFPVVQAVTLVLAASVVIINLLTDLLAARLDPRIRLR